MSALPVKAFRIVEKKPAKITLGVILALSLIAAITVHYERLCYGQ